MSLTAEKALAKCKKSKSGEVAVSYQEVRSNEVHSQRVDREERFDLIFVNYDMVAFQRSFTEWCKSVGFDVTFSWVTYNNWVANLKPASEA